MEVQARDNLKLTLNVFSPGFQIVSVLVQVWSLFCIFVLCCFALGFFVFAFVLDLHWSMELMLALTFRCKQLTFPHGRAKTS